MNFNSYKIACDIRDWIKEKYKGFVIDTDVICGHFDNSDKDSFAVALSVGHVYDITVTKRKPRKLGEVVVDQEGWGSVREVIEPLEINAFTKIYRYKGCKCQISVVGPGNFISEGPPAKCTHGNPLATKREAECMQVLDRVDEALERLNEAKRELVAFMERKA